MANYIFFRQTIFFAIINVQLCLHIDVTDDICSLQDYLVLVHFVKVVTLLY
jgi:hypothetical protein